MKILVSLIFFSFSIFAFGQSNQEDIDLIQSIYGKEKKEIVKNFVKVDASLSDAFWALYDEYETKRKAIGESRIKNLEDYANNYESLDDAKTAEILKTAMANNLENDKLINTYTKKIEKLAGAKTAGQFYHLETLFLAEVRAEILGNIPMIEKN